MKATDIYRQDNLVFVVFDEDVRINISAPNRQAARDIETNLIEVLGDLDDVSISFLVGKTL